MIGISVVHSGVAALVVFSAIAATSSIAVDAFAVVALASMGCRTDSKDCRRSVEASCKAAPPIPSA